MNFEKVAENLIEDFNTRVLDDSGDIYTYTPKYYDIKGIFLYYDIYDYDENFQFDIEDARKLVSVILEDSWNEIVNANEHKKKIFEIKLGSFKVNSPYGIFDFDEASFWIEEGELDNNTTFDDETRLALYEHYLFGNQYVENDDIKDLLSVDVQKKSNQTIIDYFKQQAKLLLKDYNLMKENDFDQSKVVFDEPQEHFDIANVLTRTDKQKGDNFTLMNTQHILAKICDFKSWKDFLDSPEAKQEIGALKLNCYKIGMDPEIIDAAKMLVDAELFADFVDRDGQVNYTDDDELYMWEHVMERLLF